MNEWQIRRRAIAVAMACVCGAAAPSWAQANVGTGPLTGSLIESEPTTGAIAVGPVKLAPGIVVREIGWDDNVFNEAVDPKEDYIASVQPDLSLFTRLRFLKLALYGAADFNYFQKYESERSTGYLYKARADVLLSRVRPFFGTGKSDTRTRPNGEIDVRANEIEEEFSGGLAFELGAYQQIYASTSFLSTEYVDAFEEGQDLSKSLNRDSRTYSAGVRTELTPLLAMTISASSMTDEFHDDPLRNTEEWAATADFKIGAEAVVTGGINISYSDKKPVDPALEHFSGLTYGITLVYPLLEVGRLSGQASRRTEYSFDTTEGYYLDTSFTLTYTQRIRGAWDVQGTGTKATYDYEYHRLSPAHTDRFESAAGSVGYNLNNRTRISVNYEYSRRRSVELPERDFQKRRVFLSWNYAL